VYVPDVVVATQFGESLRRQVPVDVPPFASFPAQPPLRPPATRVSVTPVPDPDVFQPAVSASNPGLPMRFVRATTFAWAVDA